MVDIKGKGNPGPGYGPRICQHLQDDCGLGQDDVVGESSIATTFHDMIGDSPKVVSPYHIDVRYLSLSAKTCSLPTGCVARPFRGCFEVDGCLQCDLGLALQTNFESGASEGSHSLGSPYTTTI